MKQSSYVENICMNESHGWKVWDVKIIVKNYKLNIGNEKSCP
jgi:hypothetical protein